MRSAIVHIGTEKTGSTAIQAFLDREHRALAGQGVHVPPALGRAGHHRLVLSLLDMPDPGLQRLAGAPQSTRERQRWLTAIDQQHVADVQAFQQQHADASTVVYSSEHFHSRVRHHDEILRLRDRLAPLYDRIRILVYLRRQDGLALSAHNTALQAGETRALSLSRITPITPYYDYLALLDRWANVFGEDALDVRLFEKAHLAGGDVVTDFCQAVGCQPPAQRAAAARAVNGRLSATAQAVLRAFNRLDANDPRLQGLPQARLRRPLILRLEQLADDDVTALPARADVQAFYARFREANQILSERWLDGACFNERFDEYPLVAAEVPAADVDAHLSRTLRRACRHVRRNRLHRGLRRLQRMVMPQAA